MIYLRLIGHLLTSKVQEDNDTIMALYRSETPVTDLRFRRDLKASMPRTLGCIMQKLISHLHTGAGEIYGAPISIYCAEIQERSKILLLFMRALPPHVWPCARSIYMLIATALLARAGYINTSTWSALFEVSLDMSRGLGYGYSGLGRPVSGHNRIFWDVRSRWPEYSHQRVGRIFNCFFPACRLDCPIWFDQTIKLNISQIEAKTSSGIKPLEKQISWI